MQSTTITKSLIASPELVRMLFPYQQKIEAEIKANIATLGGKSKLRDACEYALMNGGKRFRPIIVMMMAKALGNQVDVSQAALAVEYFHTASLVADDLPCMDDDLERRNKPTTHKVFGEATALLVSYALIAAGYELIASNAELIRNSSKPFAIYGDRICVLALQNATHNTGIHGASGGQYLDLYPPDFSIAMLKEVIHKKTVTLFEISFVFGWLFGGGDISKLHLVKQAASHFGMAFQIVDDLGDIFQDLNNKRMVNMAICYGKENAFQMFQEEIQGFFKTVQELGVESQDFKDLGAFLIKQAEMAIQD